MLAVARHRQIAKLLQRQGSVSTAALARLFSVTEETVRRDFEKLEAEGVLVRSHGGAVQMETERRDYPVRERATQNTPEKARIARRALRYVTSGATIFLDPSTTVQQLAHLIPNEPLTILTNSLQIPLLFEDKPSVRVIILGGTLSPRSLSCAGPAAEQTLDLYRVDSAFLSCRGIEVEQGLSEATEEQAQLKRRVIERAKSVYLLADYTKGGVSSSFFYAPLSKLDVWITDRNPESPLREALDGQGVTVDIVRK